MYDGHEVLSELLFGAKPCLIENDESDARAVQDLLNESDADPCETVAVGHHNL